MIHLVELVERITRRNQGGKCQIPIEINAGHEAYDCGKPAITFCGTCNAELCTEHAEKYAMETYCNCCAEIRKAIACGANGPHQSLKLLLRKAL